MSLHGMGLEPLVRRGARCVHLTLSHTEKHATAMAILESALSYNHPVKCEFVVESDGLRISLSLLCGQGAAAVAQLVDGPACEEGVAEDEGDYKDPRAWEGRHPGPSGVPGIP